MTVTVETPREQQSANPGSSIGSAVQEYFNKLRGGDVGSLPAIFGLVCW